MIQGSQTNDDSRVFELADGRVLFLARGRFYYVRDYPHGHSLEAKLRWAEHAVGVCFIAILLGCWWTNNWWWLLLVIPLLLLPIFADRVTLAGCPEATDQTARAEAAARIPDVAIGAAFVLPAITLLFLVGRAFSGRTPTKWALLEAAIILLAMLGAAIQIWRRRRGDREAEILGRPRSPDNTPIVPR
jgi:hypothetical protein